MEEHYSTGQSPQRAVAPMEEDEEEEEFIAHLSPHIFSWNYTKWRHFTLHLISSHGLYSRTTSGIQLRIRKVIRSLETSRPYQVSWKSIKQRQVFYFFTPEDGNDKLSRTVGSELDCIWNVMVHAQKPNLVFRWNKRVHLNRRGRQFSRLLAAEVWASAVVMLDTPSSQVVWRVLATHSIRQFPLHFTARATPCAITFQLHSTTTRCVITK
jgi:hypothetical protein